MRTANTMPHGAGERGSALIFIIVLMVTVGGLVTAHLGELNAEKRKIQTMISQQRASERALGELERAKNLVNAAPYVNDHNSALWAAIHSDPPYVPGTEVLVEKLGGDASEWYSLRATGQHGIATKSAQAFVRERSPFTAYNLFVIDHPVGLSGTPRGAIHTNRYVDFNFPWGTYVDEINAVEGFNYRAGATPENTRVWGPANPHSAPMNDVLSGLSVERLEERADTLKVTDDLIAKIEFKGKQTEVQLWTPEQTMTVTRSGTRKVFDHNQVVTEKREVKKYRVEPYEIEVPTFAEVTEQVTRRRKVYRWKEQTATRFEPVFEDRTEYYEEREPIWATRVITRVVHEQRRIDAPLGMRGRAKLIEIVVAMRADVEAGSTLLTKKAVDNIEDSIKEAENALKNLDKTGSPEWKKAIEHTDKARTKILDKAFSLLGSLLSYSNERARQFDEAITLLKADAAAFANGQVTQTAATDIKLEHLADADGLPSAEILERAETASKSRQVATGFLTTGALINFYEERYIAGYEMAKKARIKRVKVGQQLVNYTQRTRELSHVETANVIRTRRVRSGTRIEQRERRIFEGWETKEFDVEVAVYRDEPYTYEEAVVVPSALAETRVVPTRGTIYIEKNIDSMFGQINGRVSVVSNGTVQITDSIVYVDDEGRERMLDGTDPQQPYQFNPEYRGDSVLLLVATGDILYSSLLPQYVEINASMLTTHGKVAMQGISVSGDGTGISIDQDAISNPNHYVKESLRRLGGIIARKRPVASYIDNSNNVIAGFKQGVSHMDRNLVIQDGGTVLPPNVFQLNRPTWSFQVIGKHIDLAE